MKKRIKESSYVSMIAPNGVRIKMRDFKKWSQEIRVRLVFPNSVTILNRAPFK